MLNMILNCNFNKNQILSKSNDRVLPSFHVIEIPSFKAFLHVINTIFLFTMEKETYKIRGEDQNKHKIDLNKGGSHGDPCELLPVRFQLFFLYFYLSFGRKSTKSFFTDFLNCHFTSEKMDNH
jgi:hypothetical protein